MGKYIGRDNQYGVLDTQDLSSQSDGLETDFNLLYKVASASSILVVYSNNVLQPNVEFSVINSGTKISFTTAPVNGFGLFIKYLGKEVTVPSIPSFIDYVPTLSASTALQAETINEASYQEFTGLIKVRLSLTITTDASTAIDTINFTLPTNNNGSSCILSSATISSASSLEQGIVLRNSNSSFDIHRQSKQDYSLNTEYDINLISEYRV